MEFWAFFGITFLWDWNENWPFPVLWPLLSFPNLLAYWVQHFHSIIFQDLKELNWNSITSTRFVVLFPKAHLTSHSRMSGSRWVIIPSWLSVSEDLFCTVLLEKEMAVHSSILAWKISWMEEPDRPQSMGSQRVRHDWVTSLSLSLSVYSCHLFLYLLLLLGPYHFCPSLCPSLHEMFHWYL